MPEILRRSTRERKKVETIYDSAEKAGPVVLPKRKVRTSRSDVNEQDEDHAAPASDDDEDQVSLGSHATKDDDDETESSSAEESEAEERPPRTPPPLKPRTPKKNTVQRSTAAAAPVTIRKKNKAGVVAKKTTAVATGPLNRRQAIAALKALQKKYIPDEEEEEEETEENSLFVALLSSYNNNNNDGNTKATKTTNPRGDNDSFYTAGIQTIVQRVMDEHAELATATEVQLLNLILRSVGGSRDSLLDPDENDLENLSNDDMDDIIAKVMVDMGNVAADRTPFLANTLKLNHAQAEFRKLYGEFWYRLAQTALTMEGNGRDERFRVETARDLVTHLLDFLSVGQSDIRMAVAVAVYQMSKAMLERTVELQSKLTTAERQWNVAKKSNQQRKKKALEGQIESWKRTVQDLESFVELVVQTVVVRRYRDSSQFIRVLTLETLTDFCTIRPDMYVTNMYLKYFGWMLSDHDAGVRKTAIQGLLIPLEKESADTDAMDNVLAKFLGRLTDMTADVDLNVQETAMALLLKLLRSDYFEKVEDDSIWDRINSMSLDIDATPTFRRDALSFVLEQIEEFDDGTATTERKAVDQLTKLSQWLAGVLSDGDIPLDEIEYERADLVVSALRAIPEHAPLASNWSAMLHALKNDKNPRKSSSTNQRIEIVQQRLLLRMFVTAVRMEVADAGNECATNVDPLLWEAVQDQQAALATVKTTANVKSTKQKSKSDTHEELTIALLRSLPELLLRFKSETPVLASLTTLPQYFLPNVLNLSRLKKDFESLCGNLSSIFLESTDPTTLGNCLLAIVSLATGDHSRSDEAVVVLKDLANTLRDRLGELFEEHSRLAKKRVDDEESDLDDDDEPSAADVASSIHQCLRRLCVLAKRWPLSDLLTGDNNDQKLESLSESIHTFMVDELRSRIIVSEQSETQDTAATLNIPAIWQQKDNLHVDVAGSISEGMQLLLVLAAWRLSEEIDIIETDGEDYSEEQIKNHIVVRLRDRLKTVICLCYEHFISESSMDYLSKPILDFSYAVQSNALKASADLRSLLLKKWLDAESKFLQACALTDDSVLIGAGVRFVHQQSQRLRANQAEDGSDERIEEWESFLLPMARGLSSNWEVANRREGAVVLAQITGSGGATQEMVQSFSRLFKKLHFVRLLEAQMACLRENFEAWAEGEPEEIGDRPTDREMAAYEEALQAHRDSFAEMLGLATRFSASLGVGRLKDKSMVAGLFGFLREGVRFAFSTNDPGSKEDLPLGCRLSFLSLTSKYLSWIRKDKNLKVEFGNYLNQLEAEMRSHEDYADIYPEDKMILVEFRKHADLGEFHVEEESATYHDASQSRKSSIRPARNSLGSSVSSIPSKTSKQGSLESIEEEPEGKSGAGTPSPTTRSFVPSSARTMGSVSSLGTRETRGSISPVQRPKRTTRTIAGHNTPNAPSGIEFSDDDDSPKKRRKTQQVPSDDEDSVDGSLDNRGKRRHTTKASSKMSFGHRGSQQSSPGKRRKTDAFESSDGSPSSHSKFTEADGDEATKGSSASSGADSKPSPSMHSRAESTAHSEALPSIRSTNDADSLNESSDESST